MKRSRQRMEKEISSLMSASSTVDDFVDGPSPPRSRLLLRRYVCGLIPSLTVSNLLEAIWCQRQNSIVSILQSIKDVFDRDSAVMHLAVAIRARIHAGCFVPFRFLQVNYDVPEIDALVRKLEQRYPSSLLPVEELGPLKCSTQLLSLLRTRTTSLVTKKRREFFRRDVTPRRNGKTDITKEDEVLFLREIRREGKMQSEEFKRLLNLTPYHSSARYLKALLSCLPSSARNGLVFLRSRNAPAYFLEKPEMCKQALTDAYLASNALVASESFSVQFFSSLFVPPSSPLRRKPTASPDFSSVVDLPPPISFPLHSTVSSVPTLPPPPPPPPQAQLRPEDRHPLVRHFSRCLSVILRHKHPLSFEFKCVSELIENLKRKVVSGPRAVRYSDVFREYSARLYGHLSASSYDLISRNVGFVASRNSAAAYSISFGDTLGINDIIRSVGARKVLPLMVELTRGMQGQPSPSGCLIPPVLQIDATHIQPGYWVKKNSRTCGGTIAGRHPIVEYQKVFPSNLEAADVKKLLVSKVEATLFVTGNRTLSLFGISRLINQSEPRKMIEDLINRNIVALVEAYRDGGVSIPEFMVLYSDDLALGLSLFSPTRTESNELVITSSSSTSSSPTASSSSNLKPFERSFLPT